MAYVDTSVLVAAYTPNDPMYKPSRAFLQKSRPLRIISALTFEELSSVLARVEKSIQVPTSLKEEPPHRRLRAVIEYIVRDSALTIASQVGSSTIRLGGRTVVIPIEYSRASALAYRLKLRALDLLHLAYADLISRLEFSITSFVTNDAKIMQRAGEIRETLKLTVEPPE